MYLVGVIGDDPAGADLEARLTAAGVRCELLRVPDWSTIIKLRIVSRQRQLLRVDFESELPAQILSGAADNDIDGAASLRVEQDVFTELLRRTVKHLPSASSLVLQDYDKGAVATPEALIDAAHVAGVPVVVDPKHKPLARYAGADLVKPNLHEFRVAVGPVNDYTELVEAGQKLMAEHRFRSLVVTQGGNGMTVLDAADGHCHLPAQPVDVFDVTGAGDTAAAALAVTRSLGWPAADCAALANLAGGLVVSKAGTATVSGPELAAARRGERAPQSGILKRDQLLEAVRQAQEAGERIVFTNGCFDILHAGHVTYLEEARSLGERLIVAVNDDASVSRLKGPGRPVNTLDRRLRVLAGLTAVDWVVSFSEDTPEALLTLLKPEVLVKGGDYQPDQVVGADLVRSYGGTVKVLGLVEDCSTTQIVDRLNDDA